MHIIPGKPYNIGIPTSAGISTQASTILKMTDVKNIYKR